MKKIVLVLAVIIGILCINKTEKVIIPKESIRLRVIANSDCSKDQNLKKKIVKNFTMTICGTNFILFKTKIQMKPFLENILLFFHFHTKYQTKV